MTKTIEKMPALRITLAFIPSPGFLYKLHDLVKKAWGGEILLDLNHDPSILGGAIFVNHGRFVDLSLQRKIHYLKANSLIATNKTA